MDRRSFIVDSAALIAGAWGVCGRESFASVPQAAAARTVMPATTALVDMSLARSIGFASDAASAGASVLPLDGDVGALWYMRLVGIHGRLAGVLRASDAFVLARLASHAGHTVIEQPVLACTVEIAVLMRRVVR